MMDNALEFRVRSGGTVSMALERCADCETKACVRVCQEQSGPLVLDEARGVPALRWSLAEVERGGCVECLGCELDCELVGRKAVTITLPLPRLDEYRASLSQSAICKG